MDNSYFTTVNPYFQNQDQQGLMPVFQNIGQQQAMQNAALNQQNQQVQDAGAAFQQGGGMSGLNPLAMAMMLRNKKPGLGEMYDANGKVVSDPTYGSGNAYSNMTSNEIANMQANGV